MEADRVSPRVPKEIVMMFRCTSSLPFLKGHRGKEVPNGWRKTDVASNCKKGKKDNLGNYRLVSLFLISEKIL